MTSVIFGYRHRFRNRGIYRRESYNTKKKKILKHVLCSFFTPLCSSPITDKGFLQLEQRRSDDWPRLQREVANDISPNANPRRGINFGDVAGELLDLVVDVAGLQICRSEIFHRQKPPPKATANSHRFTPETGPLAQARWWWLLVAAGQRQGRLLFAPETQWQVRWKLHSSRRPGRGGGGSRQWQGSGGAATAALTAGKSESINTREKREK
ncbi:hypothetical protein LR48_Vigan01g007500 [Vigna angularis]|uniref:Uncharacterized protein n=1 Tax=Phaseolus angularis TaxID=3914 RepID=A0A0L9TJ79_PHAAN|nr:hypothetical protein LR48_Vigan01g007500 [Vigna angularis]